MNKIGFTGTRTGMSFHQILEVVTKLTELGATELHHSDCVGADEEAHKIARRLGLRIVIHPPILVGNRAFCDGDEARTAMPYLARNYEIVDETIRLIACPLGAEVPGSGTWATVRYARKRGRKVDIIYPEQA